MGTRAKIRKVAAPLEILRRIETGKGLIEIKGLQEMGIRAIVIPIPRARRSRVKDKRAEALRLFWEADTTQAKKEMVAEWNLVNPGYEISLASLYRWDRLERLAKEEGVREIKKSPGTEAIGSAGSLNALLCPAPEQLGKAEIGGAPQKMI